MAGPCLCVRIGVQPVLTRLARSRDGVVLGGQSVTERGGVVRDVEHALVVRLGLTTLRHEGVNGPHGLVGVEGRCGYGHACSLSFQVQVDPSQWVMVMSRNPASISAITA